MPGNLPAIIGVLNGGLMDVVVEQPDAEELNIITGEIVDAAVKIHKAIGPGLLENAYEICLVHELNKRGLPVERQVAIPVVHDGEKIDAGFRADLLVKKCVIVELKAVECLKPAHHAQVITYLKLTGCKIGLILNFNVYSMKNGIKRIAV